MSPEQTSKLEMATPVRLLLQWLQWSKILKLKVDLNFRNPDNQFLFKSSYQILSQNNR